MFWRVWIRTLDLYKAFGADGLTAAASLVEVWRVEEETNGAFLRVLVQKEFDGLSVDGWFVREADFLWKKLYRLCAFGQDSKGFGTGMYR